MPDTVLVARLDGLDPATTARAAALWDVDGLRASYKETHQRLAASAKRLPRLAPARAMVESFVLGGSAIRQIVLDPLLPEPLVPAAERAALVAAMREYDRVGRDCWAAFMREFEVVPERRAPVDVRIVEEAVNA
jgi:phenylacetic acid degradation operon negative regulatory protein